MRGWAARLQALGRVEAFDYPYQREGRKAPDRLPVLIAAHRAALAALGAAAPDRPIFLAGKSMGGRIGCHVALEEAVGGVICFGFPLRAAGSGASREAVLLQLRTPVLFIQGTRDPLCPLEQLEDVRRRMTAPSTLHVVEGGDHSLLLRKTDLRAIGRTQDDIDHAIAEQINAFTRRIIPSGPEPRSRT
jgi:predicted alpha/beta-hydrolase family hydrolase